MNWSARQQAMLETMGYTLWRPAGAVRPSSAGTASRVEEAGAAVPRDPSTVRRAATRDGDDPLLRALRRAAGGHDPSALLPPLDRLRGDAAAKRALWPRLRALRRR